MKLKLIILLLLTFLLNCSQGEQGETNEPIAPEPEYTKEAPGVWEGKEAEHVPVVTLKNNSKTENNVKVEIEAIFNENHYIEKVGIIDENKQTLDERDLGPSMEVNTTLSLDMTNDSYKKAKVFIKCVQHDMWTVAIEDLLK